MLLYQRYARVVALVGIPLAALWVVVALVDSGGNERIEAAMGAPNSGTTLEEETAPPPEDVLASDEEMRRFLEEVVLFPILLDTFSIAPQVLARNADIDGLQHQHEVEALNYKTTDTIETTKSSLHFQFSERVWEERRHPWPPDDAPDAARHPGFHLSMDIRVHASEWHFLLSLLRRAVETAARRYPCHDFRVRLNEDYSQNDRVASVHFEGRNVILEIVADAPYERSPADAYGGFRIYLSNIALTFWYHEHTRPHPLVETLERWNLLDIPNCNWTGGRPLSTSTSGRGC